MNDMKRVLIGLLALTLSMAALVWSGRAAGADHDVVDPVLGSGLPVTELASGTSHPFDYQIPPGGAAVLVFFHGSASSPCADSYGLLRDILDSGWLDNDKLRVLAVERGGTSRAEVLEFFQTYVAPAQALPPSLAVYTDGALVYNAYQMALGLATEIAPTVLMLTSATDGQPVIRRSWTGDNPFPVYHNALAQLTDGVEPLPIPLTIQAAQVEPRPYDGTTDATISQVRFAGPDGAPVELTLGEDYTATARFQSPEAGQDKPVEVTVTLNHPDYTLATPTYTGRGEIQRAGLEPIQLEVELEIYAGSSTTIDLANLEGLPDGEAFTFEVYPASLFHGLCPPQIGQDGPDILTLRLDPNGSYTQEDRVMVLLYGSGNYGDTHLLVTVTYVPRSSVPITGVEPASDLVYNGRPQAGYTGTPISDYEGEYEITYSGTGDTIYAGDTPPTDAGSYMVTIRIPEGGDHRGEVRLPFTIQPAAIVIKANDQRITAGQPAPEYSYQVFGLGEGDGLSQAPTLTCDADLEVPGAYPIIPSGGAVPAGGNYPTAIPSAPGPLTVTPGGEGDGDGGQGGFGGGTPTEEETTYHVVSLAQPEHGAVQVDNAAQAGSAVTITVTPNEGYEVEALTVTDSNGTQLEVTLQEDGTYTFTMPAGDVRIHLTFRQAEPEEPPIVPFTDVKASDWYAGAVEYVYANGLMRGTGDTTFGPDLPTTRAQLVTILYRLEGEPEVAGESPFADVPENWWYGKAVVWATSQGIVSGYSGQSFGPDDNITREQLTAILYRYAQRKGYDLTASGSLFAYADGNQVSGWAASAMSWASGAGLIQGSDNQLNPQGFAVRSQMAALLMRFLEQVSG